MAPRSVVRSPSTSSASRVDDDRVRPAPGVPRGVDPPARGRGASRSPRTSSTSRTTGHGSAAARRVYPIRTRCAAPATRRQSSARVERAAAAERPLIAAGDGVFWSGAAAELQRTVRTHADPGLHAARRAGGGPRGPSAGGPRRVEESLHRTRRRRAGGRLQVLERRAFRRSRRRGTRRPRTSRSIRRHRASAGMCRPRSRIVGDPKLVLRQLIDAIKGARLDGRHRTALRRGSREVAHRAGTFERHARERERGRSTTQAPMHPDRLARELCEMIDRDATVVDRQLHDERDG